MGDQILVLRAVIKNFDVLGGLEENFGMASRESWDAGDAEKQRESRDPTRDSYGNSVDQWFLVA
jgi:hypothetical protein